MRRGLSLILTVLSLGSNAHAFDRIVTLTPELGEWSTLILGDEQAKKQIIGVSEFSDHPAYLSSVKHVGPYAGINIEKVMALNPDLVLAAEENTRAGQVDQLRALKLNIVLLPKVRLKEFSSWILALGQALHAEARAKKIEFEWSQGFLELQKKKITTNKKIFVEIQHHPLITLGSESFIDEAFSAIGFENVFHALKAGYPKVSVEAVIEKSPEIIFILDQTGESSFVKNSREDWSRFKAMPAVKNDRLVTLSGDDFARVSLRLLKALKALESKYEGAHP